jgi:Tfp pilus assembly protein PilF
MNQTRRFTILLAFVLYPLPAARGADDQDQPDQAAEIARRMAEGSEALRYADLKAAKKAFRLALKLDRKTPSANFALGLIYHEEGNFKLAAQHYAKEIRISPTSGEAYLNLGAAAATMNQYPRAVLAFVNAIRRLGDDEAYVNNLGKAVHALRASIKDEKKLTPELRRALQTYEELEAHLNAKLAEKGMARWGSTKITLEQKRDIEERAMRLEQMIQEQVLQLNDFVFEVNTVRRRISQVKMSLQRYRANQAKHGALDAEVERLELRLRDLEDNIRLARANIKRLEDQKPKPPWNNDYAYSREIPEPE